MGRGQASGLDRVIERDGQGLETISHTVALPNPLSAHWADCAGVSRTRPSMAATITPAMPMIAGGIGSVISATMMVAKSAK